MMAMPTTLNALHQAFEAHFGSRIRRDELLARHTTLQLGGPADLWFAARNLDELVTAVNLAREHNAPFIVLGGGANVLISDVGLRGLVIENRAGGVQVEGSKVIAASGMANPRLVQQCIQHGLSGFEWAIGVPGTVGGAVVNNAGAYGIEMADNLHRAELLTPTGDRRWYPVGWFEYSYRNSKLKQGLSRDYIVLQAELHLTPSDPDRVRAQVQAITERRRASQPPGATLGSMFKNPPGEYAGRLIEAAGLKGHRIGQMQVSPVHANFFINLGGATAGDVEALIETVQQRVYQQFQIALELEIQPVVLP